MGLTQVSTDGVKNDAVTAGKIPANAVGSSELADDAVDIAALGATGTAGNTTYLRGDNTWTVPPDTNTTYSVGDGGLTQNNFTDADHTKLNGIAAGAEVNVQSDWNSTSGDNEILNKPTTLVAADAITGDKIADDAVGSEHIEQLDADLSFADSAKAVFGAGNDLWVYHSGSSSWVYNATGVGDLNIGSNDGTVTMAVGSSANEVAAKFISNGACELYYDNAKKIETTSAGVTVTGDVLLEDNTPTITLKDTNDSDTTGEVAHTSGNLKLKADSNNVIAGSSIRFEVDGTEQARIADGISFNGDSAANNFLNDYEKGNWTPHWSNGFHSGATYYTQMGKYVKVGRHVTFNFYIYVNDADTDTNPIQVGGLPYASSNESGTWTPGSGSITYHTINTEVSMGAAGLYFNKNATLFSVYNGGSAMSGANNQAQNGQWLIGGGTYMTD